jgi:hypothetical protein
MKALRLFPVLLLILAACGTDDPTGPGQRFTGSWVWVASVGGIAGLERTPTSEGLVIRLDYDGRSVRAFRNGELVSEVGYSAVELPTLGPLPVYSITYDSPVDAFPFDLLDEHTVVRVAPSIIRFEDPCCDRWTHTMVDATVRD